MKKDWIYVLFVLFTLFSCNKDDSDPIGWEKVNTIEIGSNSIISVAVTGTNIYAVSSDIKNTLLKSADSGLNWATITGIPKNVNSVTVLDQYIFAGTSGGVYRSADNGITWSSINTGLPLSWGQLSSGNPFVCSNKLYLNYGGVIYNSTDNGGTWSEVTTGLAVTPVNAFTLLETYSIAATSKGIYRATNNANWSAAITDNKFVRALTVSGKNAIAGSTNGFYYSTDNCANWALAKIADETNQNPSIECFTLSNNNVYAGAQQSKGVYLSMDNGATWSTLNTGFNDIPSVRSIVTSGKHLYVGTNNGIWRRPL